MYNIDNKYDLPRDVISSDFLCQIIGDKEIVIENYKCIQTISNNLIEIKGFKNNLFIKGNNLTILYYNNYCMKIGGVINEISLLRNSNTYK